MQPSTVLHSSMSTEVNFSGLLCKGHNRSLQLDLVAKRQLIQTGQCGATQDLHVPCGLCVSISWSAVSRQSLRDIGGLKCMDNIDKAVSSEWWGVNGFLFKL